MASGRFFLAIALLAAVAGCNDVKFEAGNVVREASHRAVHSAGDAARGGIEAAKDAAKGGDKKAKEDQADKDDRDALRGVENDQSK